MSADKTMENIKTAATQAEQLEKEAAQAQKDNGAYTHVFQEPFT